MLFIILILSFPLQGFCADPGTEIIQKVYDRYEGDDSEATYMMTLENEGGDRRIREMTIFRKDFGDLEKRLIRFSSPAEIAGTGFLNWDNIGKGDDQFLYLPALKRVRRVVSTQKHLRFVNTDFTNEDMERREVELDDHELLDSEDYRGLKCHIIRSTPRESTNSQYGHTMSWVAKDIDLPVKVEYYDRKGNHVKTYEAQALKKIDGIWTGTKTVMTDNERKHRTTLELKSIQYNKGLPDNYFTKAFLSSY
ncbi:outer membrane lipoprotein-sorting protein [Candidatus Moduliflexota bacterium]